MKKSDKQKKILLLLAESRISLTTKDIKAGLDEHCIDVAQRLYELCRYGFAEKLKEPGERHYTYKVTWKGIDEVADELRVKKPRGFLQMPTPEQIAIQMGF